MSQASEERQRSTPEQVVIIGSGPAAWTAAIYASRAMLDPVVYEGELSRDMLPGGQLMTTTEVENYPGSGHGITGPDLMERIRGQAQRLGVRVVADRIAGLDISRYPFSLETGTGQAITASAVIVATGARAKWLGLPNETRLALTGGGVSACAVCDGALPFYRNRVLAVVGGGDSAMEEALYLTKFASEVVLLYRRDSFRAARVMADRVLSHPRIRVRWNTRVVDVLGEGEITAVRVADTGTGEESVLPVGGLFVAIGHTPNTAFLGGQLALRADGYIALREPGRMATSVAGVFAAGDVMDSFYRQAITAAGTGAMAAIEAERWLAHK